MTEWISVKNELPPKYEDVLTCFYRDGSLGAKTIRARIAEGWIDDHFEFCPNECVTHWQWLPTWPEKND